MSLCLVVYEENLADGDRQKVLDEEKDVVRDNQHRRQRRSATRVTRRDTDGFWSELKTGRWMLVPGKFCPLVESSLKRLISSASSFKLLLITLFYHVSHTLLIQLGIISPSSPNYASWLLFLHGQQSDGTYGKHRGDIFFVAHQVIWWSL